MPCIHVHPEVEDNRFFITSWSRARICQPSCIAFSQYSHLRHLRCLSHTLYTKPRTQIHQYEAGDVSQLLDSMIRSSRSTTLLKFGSKPLSKKLKNLGLSLRRRPWRFRTWLRGLDWLKCFRPLIETNGEQHLSKELWRCLFAMRRSWRTRFLTHQNLVLDFFKSYSATG